MKFIRKTDTLNEGVFKSIDNIRAERDKERELSSEDRLAKKYSEFEKKNLYLVLTKIMKSNLYGGRDSNDLFNLYSEFERVYELSPASAEMEVYDAHMVNLLPIFEFKYDIDTANKVITVDCYMNKVGYIDFRNDGNMKEYTNNFGEYADYDTGEAGIIFKKASYIESCSKMYAWTPEKINKDFEYIISVSVRERLSDSDKHKLNETEKLALEKLLDYKFVVNKVHVFQGLKVNVTINLHHGFFGRGTLYSATAIKKMAALLNAIFSFENTGVAEITYIDSNTKRIEHIYIKR